MKINIIGAGISGLTAAYYLQKEGHQVNIIEKSDRVGGRMKTDKVDGYLLDRGFQVFLTAYPEAKAVLDYDALDLKYFMAGSAIFTKDGLKEIGDPARELSLVFKTVFSSIPSLSDKWNTLKLKKKSKSNSIDNIFANANNTTIAFLKDNFSPTYIDSFWKPFYKGIFLDNKLETSSQMFHYVFKMFTEGFATIPALGMEEIPKQLASKLKNSEFFFNTEVVSIEGNTVFTRDGQTIEADVTLIATEAGNLAGKYYNKLKIASQSVTNLYFLVDNFDYKDPAIMLTPEAEYVNNICCMNHVSKQYAPAGKSLISVSVIPNDKQEIPNLEKLVKTDLEPYFKDVATWKHLKTYHIPYALPKQDHVVNYLTAENYKIKDNLFICGDHLYNGSINAAMKTGRLAARSILK
ncbi:MAG: phytoene dehydrogenase-like protein [Maribacter sp.]|jgi:phytoene dehydrogenase-like protein